MPNVAGCNSDTKQVTQVPGVSGWAEVSMSQEKTRPRDSSGSGLRCTPCLTVASARGLHLLFTLMVGRVRPLVRLRGED